MNSMIPISFIRDALRGRYAVVPSINSGNVRFFMKGAAA
jgi:hypothetical protein